MYCNCCKKEFAPNEKRIWFEGLPYCANCNQYLYTCATCLNGNICEFETNPSPSPKMIQNQIRQGNMIIQTVVKNPERIAQFCSADCLCWNAQDNDCGKTNSGVCTNWKILT